MTLRQILNEKLVGKKLQRPNDRFPYNGWTITRVDYGAIKEAWGKEFSISITNGEKNVSLIVDFDWMLTEEE